jgi:hypothetical protein
MRYLPFAISFAASIAADPTSSSLPVLCRRAKSSFCRFARRLQTIALQVDLCQVNSCRFVESKVRILLLERLEQRWNENGALEAGSELCPET